MKFRHKLLISLAAGLLAMLLYTTPAWLGVLFSPVAHQLTCVPLSEDEGGFWRWETEDGVVLRLKSLDALLALFGGGEE